MGWKEHLITIYGKQIKDEWFPRIEERIRETKKNMATRMVQEKKQNVILITYPDQISDAEGKLRGFEKFSEQYIKDVFDVIHFLPFCPYSSDDGFSVIDYQELAAGLGTWEDLERISKKYTLMYDFVCNHVSAESTWFQECLKGNDIYRKYFIEVEPDTDLTEVTRPRTTPLLTEFETAQGKKSFWTTFSADQIDLNYANPEVFYAAIDVLLTYLEKGASWIRLDAVGFLWKEIGTTCMHHRLTHEAVKVFRGIMDEVCPEGRIITETNVPHKDNISYFGNGTDESHMVYQFSLPMLVLYSFYKQNAERLSEWAESLRLPSEKASFFNFLASHDGIGINPVRNLIPGEDLQHLLEHLEEKCGALISYKRNPDGSDSAYEVNVSYFNAVGETYDFEIAKRRFITAHAVLLAMRGDPAIYIHSYLGSENNLEGVKRTGMNRTINREKFQYLELTEELIDKTSHRAQIRACIEELIRIRKNSDAFNTTAEQKILHLDRRAFSIMRIGKQRKVLCLHNFSEKEIKIEVEKGRDMFTGMLVEQSVSIRPFDFCWIEMQE